MLNSEKYRDIVKRHMISYCEGLTQGAGGALALQQDNDLKHTSELMKAYFEQEGVVAMEWPPNTPDLSPIENLWGIIKISKRFPKNKSELHQYLLEGWNNIPFSTLVNFVDLMDNRIIEVIDKK